MTSLPQHNCNWVCYCLHDIGPVLLRHRSKDRRISESQGSHQSVVDHPPEAGTWASQPAKTRPGCESFSHTHFWWYADISTHSIEARSIRSGEKSLAVWLLSSILYSNSAWFYSTRCPSPMAVRWHFSRVYRI